ncbi:MAG: exodeoxyribonuclease VII small subunit [Candidatus Binatia bacterium]|jgi:exodeoxyribonuclease VII small subunit|nr:exodeoxyribonuclease VII small subunit [Candidatus Binatia bacterium]
MAKKKEREEKKFEVAVGELEEVVERLESGDLSLEESLAVFEKGVKLVEFCNKRLREVEKRIDLLVKDRDGQLQLTPMEDLGEEELEERES